MQQTLLGRYPYPDYFDPPNGGDQTRQLGEAVEQDVVLKFADAAARDAIITSPQPGMLVLLTAQDPPLLTTYKGGKWQVYFPDPPPVIWTRAPYQPGYSFYAGWPEPSYCKDARGLVHMRGSAWGSGPIANGIVTLPSGFRPAKRIGFVTEYFGFKRMDIPPSGLVQWDAANYPIQNPHMAAFDGIVFDPVGGVLMGTTTTPIAKYRIPDDDQPPDGPVQLGQLAQDIETTTTLKFSNAAARDTALPFPGNGQKVFLAQPAPGVHQVYNDEAKRWDSIVLGTLPPLVWTNLTLGSSWQVYDPTTWVVPGYTKDIAGIVHLRGLLKSAANGNGSGIATLPVGYRPPRGNIAFPSNYAGGSWIRVVIGNDGVISPAGSLGVGQYIFLDGIQFSAA